MSIQAPLLRPTSFLSGQHAAFAKKHGQTRDLLVRERRHVRARAGVLGSHGRDVPIRVEVKLCVFVEVARLDDGRGLELDVKGVGVPEVFDSHVALTV